MVYIKFIMKTISLKIDDSIFGEIEKILARIKKPRNRYINESIEYYNKIQRKQILEKKHKMESGLVKEDSMSELKDFEEIDYAD
jgi:predicted transcriptional regulator